MKDDFILIMEVSQSYFSVARYSGEARINGEIYTYHPERDILIRSDWNRFYKNMNWDDFVAAVKTGIKPKLEPKNKILAERQESLFGNEL